MWGKGGQELREFDLLSRLDAYCVFALPTFETARFVYQQNGSGAWGEDADGGRARGEASRDFAKVSLCKALKRSFDMLCQY